MSNAKLKRILRERYGGKCSLCGRYLKKEKQTLHHRQPKSCNGKDTLSNSCIICEQCSIIIHRFKYGSEAYTTLDNAIAKNLKKNDKYEQ